MAEDLDLRYPIGKANEQQEFESGYSKQLKVQLLNEIKMLPSNLEYAIQNLDAAQLNTAYRRGGWTIQQLVHHIGDSHINAYTRFKLGLTEENPIIKPYDQDAWAALPDSQLVPMNLSLTLLHVLHNRWYVLMQNLTKEQWQRTIYHPEKKKEISLWELLKMYAWHSRHHAAHITALRERNHWV